MNSRLRSAPSLRSELLGGGSGAQPLTSWCSCRRHGEGAGGVAPKRRLTHAVGMNVSLFLPIFCILHNQVMTPSLHVMAKKYSHMMVCHMSDCMVLVDQARDESCG